jgi:RHS repeat-associated protein
MFGFDAEQTDATGLQYLRARYYSLSTGRFIGQDTGQNHYDQPLSLNKWNFGLSNPVRYTDPSGKDPITDCALFFGTLAIADGPLPFGEGIGGIGCLGMGIK